MINRLEKVLLNVNRLLIIKYSDFASYEYVNTINRLNTAHKVQFNINAD